MMHYIHVMKMKYVTTPLDHMNATWRILQMMNVLMDIGSFLLLALILTNALKIKMPAPMGKFVSILKETILVKHQRNSKYIMS